MTFVNTMRIMKKQQQQKKNSNNPYNVLDLFNDYDAFNCTTPTTYYPLNQFASVSHSTKNCTFSSEEFENTSGSYPPTFETIPPFSDFDPFSPSSQVAAPAIFIPVQAPKTVQLQLPLQKKGTVVSAVRALPEASYKVENDRKKQAEPCEQQTDEEKKRPAQCEAQLQDDNDDVNENASHNENEDHNKQQQPDSAVNTVECDSSNKREQEEQDNKHDDNEQGVISVDIKPARKTGKFYIKYFPEKLYCTPYKYDVRVRFSPQESHSTYSEMLENGHEQSLVFKLLDGETRKAIKSNSKGEHALIVEKCKRNEMMDAGISQYDDEEEHDHKRSQVIYRLCFTVCSFHNFRRPFIIQCSEKNSGLIIFESNPFHIFARKTNRDKQGDAWGGDPEPVEKLRTLFSGLEDESVAPVTVHQNSKSSSKRKRNEQDDSGDRDPELEAKRSKPSSPALRIQLPPKFQQHATTAEPLSNLD